MCVVGVICLIYGYIYWLVIYCFDLDGYMVECIVFGDWYEQGLLLCVMYEGVELVGLLMQ